MKKVAIVGVEGSGKTVMLACLGELYTRPDKNGNFLEPKDFQTAAYVMDKIARMRKGEWPMATSDDVMQGLNWTLRRRNPGGGTPEKVCEISFLDFGGEVYRAAFGIRGGVDEALSNEIKQLKDYVSAADELIVLVNLRDVINKGASDKRVYESIWITKSILDSALNSSEGTPPRASIAITQSDSYADTIRTCGGAKRVIEEYLPHIYNGYDWLDMYDVTAVDKTVLNDDGNLVPDPGFKADGLRVLMDWIIKSGEKDGSNTNSDKAENTRLAIEAFLSCSWEEAFRLSKNADLNDSTLQSYLGDMYAVGWGVAKDESEAVKWYRKSAEQGDARAQGSLGAMYFVGWGVTRDYLEAEKWFRKAAEQGDAKAQCSLGEMYAGGFGVAKDDSEALKWYRKAAEQGHSDAQSQLGFIDKISTVFSKILG